MKLFIAVLISLLLCSADGYATTHDSHPRKKIGLVLSGGGAKGMAHIGALKVMEEAGIPIDYVVGTSMGSIIGGLYAIGYTPHQLDSLVRVQDWAYLLSDRTPRSDKNMSEREMDEKYVLSVPFSKISIKEVRGGLIKGQNIDNLFNQLTLGYHDSIDFNRLPIPFACVSEDIVTGNEVVFHQGKLTTAMRASMAIPGVFTPVRLDSMVLVDGGTVNNYPVNVAKAMGADIIIGVDVQSNLKPSSELEGAADILGQLINLMGKEQYEQNLKETNTYIKVDVEGYSAASFTKHAIDTLIERGEQAARKQWDAFMEIKRDLGYPPSFQPHYNVYHPIEKVYIRNIQFNGIDKEDEHWIINRCNLHEDSFNEIHMIEEATTIIRANTSYSSASYNLSKVSEDVYDLIYTLNKKQENRVNVGVRFDTEEVASVLVNITKSFNSKLPSYASVTARLGERFGGRLAYGLEVSPLATLGLSYGFNYNDIDYYREGKRSFNSVFRYHVGELSYANVWLRNMRFNIGLRYELYDYDKFMYMEDTPSHNDVEKEHFYTYFANLHYDTYDKAYFPSKGVNFKAGYTLYTDNFTQYDDHTPFSAVAGIFEGVIPVTRRFSILPSISGRFLIGKHIPYSKRNTMGGDMIEKYLPYQLPFIGTSHVEMMNNSLVIGGIKLRQRMGNIHYLTLGANYALSSRKLKGLFDEESMFGCAITYGMDSVFGPLEASLNYTNHSDKVGLYINLGYKF